MIRVMKQSVQKWYWIAVVILVGSFQHSYAADGSGSTAKGVFSNPINAGSIEEIIAKILEFVVKIGTVITVFFVIYSGFLFVKAQGNEQEISKAKTVFLWTVVGAVILIGAKVLAAVICNTAVGLGAPGTSCSSLN